VRSLNRWRRHRVVLALILFAGAAVGTTGGLLLERHRAAALAAVCERQQLIVSLQARLLDGELERLMAEVARLSRLAEVDLADGTLEPEKRVLRVARRDTATFSVSVLVVDEEGRTVWAEPPGARLGIDPRRLLAHARGSARPAAVSFASGEIDVAAPIAGRGAIVAQVTGRGRDLYGEPLLGALRGGAAELLAESGEEMTHVAGAGLPFPFEEDADGQSWRTDAQGRRWLVTEVHVPTSPLGLRLAQPAEALEDEVARPLRSLGLLVAVALFLAGVGAALLGGAIRRLDRAEAELGRARDLSAMGRTAAAIAHEVKNSLNGLSVALDLLAARRAPPQAAAEVHAQAREEIERLRGVAEDLTLFAAPPRLEAGEADLEELCRRAAASLGALARDCGATIELDLPEGGAGLRVAGDAHKLMGAVANLVRNGLEAMGPGAFGEALGERVERERRLVIALRRTGDRAVLDVADRGAGLSPEVSAHLFEPFVTTKRTGTGLGLAIARRVVEAHGGTVEAEARPGGGTTFRVTLPCARAVAGVTA
jgi:signal transduction histidine kinase